MDPLPSTTEAPERSRYDRIDSILLKLADNLNKVNEKTNVNTTRLDQLGAKVSRLESREDAFEKRLGYIEKYYVGAKYISMSAAGPSSMALTPPYSSPDDNRRPRRRQDGQETQHFQKKDLERVAGSNKLRCPLCQKGLSPGYVLVHANLGKCQRRQKKRTRRNI